MVQGPVGSVAEVRGPRAPCPDPSHHLCPGGTDVTPAGQAVTSEPAGVTPTFSLLSHKHDSRKETWCWERALDRP